jgi:hypothetical protein
VDCARTWLVKAFAGTVAAAAAFALIGGGVALAPEPIQGWRYLALFVAVPAAVLAFASHPLRIFCFSVGIIGSAATSAMELGGPDSALLVFPLIAYSIAGAALLSEVSVRGCQRLIRL